MAMLKEYFEIYTEKMKEYGEKTAILIQNGAFFECYQRDEHYPDCEKIGNANIIARVLNNMKYTGKYFGKSVYINFMGFTSSSLDKYLTLLLNANYTVIIVSELQSSSDINKPKGNLKRGITNIYSPSLQPIENESNNLLCILINISDSKSSNKKNASIIHNFNISVCCINNGYNTIELTENTKPFNLNDVISLNLCLDELERIIYKYFPKEFNIKIKIQDNSRFSELKTIKDFFYNNYENVTINLLGDIEYNKYSKIEDQNLFLRNMYKYINFANIEPIEYLNLKNYSLSTINLIYTIEFISKHDLSYTENLSIPKVIVDSTNLILELNTISQLNILKSNASNASNTSKPESVFDVINHTKTSIGRRSLTNLLCKPFKCPDTIEKRYNITEEIEKLDNKKLNDLLSNIIDFEKLHRKMGLQLLHPYEFGILNSNYNTILEIIQLFKTSNYKELLSITPNDNELCLINEYIKDYSCIFDLNKLKGIELTTTKDDIINYFNINVIPELDTIQNNIQNYEEEKEKIRIFYDSLINKNTEIEMIKLIYSENDGYELTCTKIRFKLLQNKNLTEKMNEKISNTSVKFCPDELYKLSLNLVNKRKLLHVKIKSYYMEYLRYFYLKYNSIFIILKGFVEIVDICNSNLKCKQKYNYTKPEITKVNNSFFEAKQLRHPIIERLGTNYIPNDISLNDNNCGMLLYGLNSSGKCFSPLTKIMLFDGSIKYAKDIIIGDKLMGDAFDYKNVLSTTKGISQMYKITPKNGESFECNGLHILCLKSNEYSILIWDDTYQRYKVTWTFNQSKFFDTKNYSSKEEAYKEAKLFKDKILTEIIDISVEDYMKKGTIWKKNYYLYRVPVEFPYKEVKLNPYLLGFWLTKEKVLKREELKGIPIDYLRNNRKIRLSVLAGLLDSNGYINPSGTGYCIIQKEKTLFNDIIDLVKSLGLSAYKVGNSYKCNILGTYNQLNEIPMLNTKINKVNKIMNNKDIVHFRIDKLKVSKYCGFEVDGNHRFLLNDYTVTHNSSLLRAIGVNIILAQCGLFVPCKRLEYYPFDTIISQVDLTDNLFSGKSSFITEMTGLKTILKCSGKNTLCLADEVLKGTETNSAMGLIVSMILSLTNNNTKFFLTSHLHEIPNIQEIQEIVNSKLLQIKHLGVSCINNNIVYDRILQEGSGSKLYGIEVAKNILQNNNFIDTAFKIRKDLIKETSNILTKKKSVYNKKKNIDKCEICSSKKNLETDHIKEQQTADINGFVPDGYHKNELFNLAILCKSCHLKKTQGSITIYGYKDSINGKFLDFKLN